MAATITLAEPSMACATGLDGFRLFLTFALEGHLLIRLVNGAGSVAPHDLRHTGAASGRLNPVRIPIRSARSVPSAPAVPAPA